jgi:hypothetical protein
MCVHHEQTALFELCKHAASKYSVGGKEDFHTIGHMSTVGACRVDAVLLDRTVKGKE